MQKKVIALAVAGLVSGAAFAQSNVTIYGMIDTGVFSYKSEGQNGTTRLNSTGSSASGNGSGDRNGTRLGFRGTEDLGNGLKAGFVYEYGVNLTTSQDAAYSTSGSLANTFGNLRQGFISLGADKFGTVKLGTQYVFVDEVAGTQATDGVNGPIGAGKLLKYQQDARLGNAINYESPIWAGFSFKLGGQISEATKVSTGTPTQNSGAGKALQAKLSYVNGPVVANYAYEKVSQAQAGSDGLISAGFYANNSYAINSSIADKTFHIVGASYNFGFIKPALHYSQYEADFNAAGATTANYTKLKSQQWSPSIAVPIGSQFVLQGAYTYGTVKADGVKAFKDQGYDLTATYSLSKRTNVYAAYRYSKFDTQGILAGTPDIKLTEYGVGVRHSF